MYVCAGLASKPTILDQISNFLPKIRLTDGFLRGIITLQDADELNAEGIEVKM